MSHVSRTDPIFFFYKTTEVHDDNDASIQEGEKYSNEHLVVNSSP